MTPVALRASDTLDTTDPAPSDGDEMESALLRMMREHMREEVAVQREGLRGIRDDVRGLRSDMQALGGHIERAQRNAFLVAAVVMLVAIVAVVAIAGGQIHVRGLGADVGTTNAATSESP